MFVSNCCINLSPQHGHSPQTTLSPPYSSSISTSLPSKASQFSWPQSQKSWKSQCMLGVAAACIVISLETGSSLASTNQEPPSAGGVMGLPPSSEQSKSYTQRWSDKRSCPPWRVNALENIVPENLPRPSARRRWESVGLPTDVAPAVKFVKKRSGGGSCFSL